MKNRIIYGGAAAAVLLVAVLFQTGGRGGHGPRYHQHLEEPGEQELGVCGVCQGTESLCTHLPLIRIDTGGQKIPGRGIVNEISGQIESYETTDAGEEEILVTLETVEEAGVYHHAQDPASLTSRAFFRIRGNSSRLFDKSNYRIRLVEEEDLSDNRRLSLLGMSAESEWALHGPFLDKTLIRNYMWMNLSAEVMGDAPDVRFCELMIDGEYKGVYVLMETICEGEGRVDLTDYEPGSPVCSYILEIGKRMDPEKVIDNFSFYTEKMEAERKVELLYPGRSMQTEMVKNYVAADFGEIEKLLYSAEMTRKTGSYRRLLDVDSFVDYYILQEFLSVIDAFSASTYFYRDVRGKLTIGPVWDYNNALDNFFLPVSEKGFLLAQKGWYAQLMMDEDFVEQVIRRYRSLRKGILSEERLNRYMDETIAWLGSAVERNYEVWGYSFDPMTLESYQRRAFELEEGESVHDMSAEEYEARLWGVNPDSYEEAVEWMREYMTKRGEWLDENIDSLRQYCRESRNASYVID